MFMFVRFVWLLLGGLILASDLVNEQRELIPLEVEIVSRCPSLISGRIMRTRRPAGV